MDIFSANLIHPARPLKMGKVLHWHNEPKSRGFTCDDQAGAFKSARKALAECPDGWQVVPCYWNHTDAR